MFQYGELNLKLNQTGKQGNFISGGIMGGYQFLLNKSLKLDMGLGLGYNYYKYESYYYSEGKNIKKKSNTGTAFLPLKANASLVINLK